MPNGWDLSKYAGVLFLMHKPDVYTSCVTDSHGGWAMRCLYTFAPFPASFFLISVVSPHPEVKGHFNELLQNVLLWGGTPTLVREEGSCLWRDSMLLMSRLESSGMSSRTWLLMVPTKCQDDDD